MPLRGIGNLYYKLADHDKALSYFEKFIELDDTYIAVLTMAGNIYRRRKQYEKAAFFYEKALKQETLEYLCPVRHGRLPAGVQVRKLCWLLAERCWKRIHNQNLHSPGW